VPDEDPQPGKRLRVVQAREGAHGPSPGGLDEAGRVPGVQVFGRRLGDWLGVPAGLACALAQPVDLVRGHALVPVSDAEVRPAVKPPRSDVAGALLRRQRLDLRYDELGALEGHDVDAGRERGSQAGPGDPGDRVPGR